jgi:hypothetical protein
MSGAIFPLLQIRHIIHAAVRCLCWNTYTPKQMKALVFCRQASVSRLHAAYRSKWRYLLQLVFLLPPWHYMAFSWLTNTSIYKNQWGVLDNRIEQRTDETPGPFWGQYLGLMVHRFWKSVTRLWEEQAVHWNNGEFKQDTRPAFEWVIYNCS